jgi:hypothetical protein
MFTFLDLNSEFKVQAKVPLHVRLNSLSQSSTLTTVIPVAFIATGIEPATLINVNRDVEDIGIIVESLLNTISCLNVSILFYWIDHVDASRFRHTMMDIPRRFCQSRHISSGAIKVRTSQES